MNSLSIFTDGGARNNPGPAAIGVVVKNDQGETIFEMGKTIGFATNNEAEYEALIFALNWLKENPQTAENITFFLDSLLVVSQMNGKFKIKTPHIKILWQRAKTVEISLNKNVKYHLIPRDKNSRADLLLNSALDKAASS
jgi:ribonuclease HI